MRKQANKPATNLDGVQKSTEPGLRALKSGALIIGDSKRTNSVFEFRVYWQDSFAGSR
jgi:hypothetical protein